MATFVSDTFTETSNTKLTSHTGETGATWSDHASGQQNASNYINIDATNDEAYLNTTVAGANYIYSASGVPADADQDVRAYLVRRGAYNTGQGIRVYARMTTGTLSCYAILIVNNSASGVTVQPYKWVSGTPTSLASASSAVAMTTGAEVIFRLLVIGTAIRTYYSTDDGGSWTNLHTVTDSSVTTKSLTGLALTDMNSNGASAQICVTKFVATDGATLGGGPPILTGRRAIRGLYTR